MNSFTRPNRFVSVQVDGAKITTQIEQPWHLEVNYPDGEAAHGAASRVWVANTNNEEVLAHHIVLHVAAPPPGRTLVVTAGVAYKNKSKPGAARIVSSSPDGLGGVEVVVEAALKPHRTTGISVSPDAPWAGWRIRRIRATMSSGNLPPRLGVKGGARGQRRRLIA